MEETIETIEATATHEPRNITRHHRKVVTVVRFADGAEVAFTERTSKRDAIAQARQQRIAHPEYFAPKSTTAIHANGGK